MGQGATVRFSPPARTAFVRWVNRQKRLRRRLDRGELSLDSKALVDEAIRRSGLMDFGDESFREPCEAFLAGLREDVELTPFGHQLVRAHVVDWLQQRLMIQRELKRHPEILDRPVPRPLIIVGPPRTGTTLLNHLLAQDPAGRSLRTWEALWPVSPFRRMDLRRWLGGLVVWFANRWVMPDWNRMHPFTREGPEECAFLLAHTFLNPALMPVRTYREWFRQQPDAVFDRGYAGYRQALQVLQWQDPADGHWVLKSPVHFWALDALMKALPQANIIHTHRHMAQVIPSYCSLQAVLLSVYTDQLDPTRMGALMVDIATEAIERSERAREQAGPGRILDLNYRELVTDPIAAVRRIYDELGYAFTPAFEERLHTFLARDRASGRPRHQYTLEQFGLDEDMVTEAFAGYHARHGLEP